MYSTSKPVFGGAPSFGASGASKEVEAVTPARVFGDLTTLEVVKAAEKPRAALTGFPVSKRAVSGVSKLSKLGSVAARKRAATIVTRKVPEVIDLVSDSDDENEAEESGRKEYEMPVMPVSSSKPVFGGAPSFGAFGSSARASKEAGAENPTSVGQKTRVFGDLTSLEVMQAVGTSKAVLNGFPLAESAGAGESRLSSTRKRSAPVIYWEVPEVIDLVSDSDEEDPAGECRIEGSDSLSTKPFSEDEFRRSKRRRTPHPEFVNPDVQFENEYY